jgi:hypothetical protein
METTIFETAKNIENRIIILRDVRKRIDEMFCLAVPFTRPDFDAILMAVDFRIAELEAEFKAL